MLPKQHFVEGRRRADQPAGDRRRPGRLLQHGRLTGLASAARFRYSPPVARFMRRAADVAAGGSPGGGVGAGRRRPRAGGHHFSHLPVAQTSAGAI